MFHFIEMPAYQAHISGFSFDAMLPFANLQRQRSSLDRAAANKRSQSLVLISQPWHYYRICPAGNTRFDRILMELQGPGRLFGTSSAGVA
jgi:hypothetical protein